MDNHTHSLEKKNIQGVSESFDYLSDVKTTYIRLAIYYSAITTASDSILTSSVGSSSTMESFTMYGFTDYNRKGKVNTLLLKIMKDHSLFIITY